VMVILGDRMTFIVVMVRVFNPSHDRKYYLTSGQQK